MTRTPEQSLEAKNAALLKQLEIEAALERVRTIAMGMRKPDDLLNICQVLFEEFKALGFADLRNAMINILHDEEGYFLDYDYNDSGASVTPFLYNSFPMMERQVELTRSASDAFIEHALTGDELEDFKAFRERNGEPPDPKLENIAGLYYYFYSIGIGSLGISTFSALTGEKLEVLKRFRNVFELAYRRYADIELAEAQAKEARLEAALERVRTVAMSMRAPDDLLSICKALFTELQLLDFSDLRNAIIHTYLNVNYLTDYDYSDFKQGHISHIPYNDNPIAEKYAEDIRKTKDAFAELIITGSKLKEWKVFMDANNEVPDERLDNATSLYYYIYAVGDASIGISAFTPISGEKLEVLKRFRNVFDLAYRRYTDIQLAATQAREAQVELALERVRARTMAMQHSDELSETAYILFQQFKELGENPDQATIGIVNEAENVIEYWVTMYGSQINKVFKFPIDEPIVTYKIYKAWKAKKTSLVIDLSGKELRTFTKFRESMGGAKFDPKEKRRVINVAFFSKGLINVQSSEERSAESIRLLERFAGVFDGTYTRFLDLKKAEAQAKEAQIQLALERVRARTTAMQKSDELHEVIQLVFDQLQQLNFNIDNANFVLNLQETDDLDLWIAVPGARYATKLSIPHFDHPVFTRFNKAKKKGGLFTDTLSKSEKNSFFKHFFKYTPEVTKERQASVFSHPGFARSAVFMKNTALTIINYRGIPFSEAENNTLLRFGEAFDQTYTRFNDLQKAEEQARESQIQLALERVRARTSAMQKSDELAETVSVLFKQLLGLGIPTAQIRTCGIVTFDTNKPVGEQWITDLNGDVIARSFMVPYDEAPAYKTIYKWWKQGKEFEVNHLEGNALQEHLGYLAKYTKVPLSVLSEQSSEIYNHVLFFSQGCLFIITRSAMTEYHDVFRRFGAVFQQSYTRFLDLQKAEEQAREGQIEAALERVRSKTMAMHTSEHVGETVATMFDELVKLGIEKTVRCGILIIDETKHMEVWTAAYDADGKVDMLIGRIDMMVHPLISGIHDAWTNKKQVKTYELAGKDLKAYYKAINDSPEYPVQFDLDLLPAKQTNNAFFFPEGAIFAFTLEPLSENAVNLFKRFAGVFGQTYRRYLDLQKAEAQARESQIQLALERVRARTMAMQNSDELRDIVKVVFERLQELNFAIEGAAFIMTPGSTDKEINSWIGDNFSEYPNCFRTPFYETPIIIDLFNAMRSGSEFFSQTYPPDEKNEWFNYAFEHTDFKNLPGEVKSVILAQEYLTQCFALTKNSAVGIIFHDKRSLSQNEIDILKRFSKVFEQSYTRFLDLQKAENQARESQIEVALERVRSKAMAMRSSSDLNETSNMAFVELRKLGIDLVRCGVGLMEKHVHVATIHAATNSAEGGSLDVLGRIDMDIHPICTGIYKHWEQNRDYFPVLEGESLRTYYEALSDSGVSTPEWKSDDKQYGYFLPFADGSLYAWSGKQESEATVKTLKRFASVFGLTHTRYLELQRAELNTKEAVKQASLDRVRAEIASMRTRSDLERITPLIWNELTILGIPFTRCGVFIVDEAAELIHTHLSTSDGKGLATFDLAFDSEGIGLDVLPAWRKRQVATVHWSKEEFAEYTKNLVSQGTVKSGERYVTEHPDTSLDLHFLPFLQGMLYVGNTAPLTMDETDLVQSLADAFSTAYARYEDFNKLEIAKQQVENTLTDLKAAQTKLIQSEKMASLGELTAGIAHEIQNPLNFVNNFSEVNQEMLDELKAESQKPKAERDDQLEIELINDLIANEQKINHHGKRADAIVKGMLQHSRTGGGEKQPTNINALADEFMRLSYHGLRAKDKVFNAELVTHFDPELPKISVIGQDMGRVLLNLFNNAFYAVNQKKKALNVDYKPEVTVTTSTENGQLIIKVKDNGVGMPEHIKEKIMQPFFTTKPTGEGTGLGLSLTYDMVVKGHGGTIQVNSAEGEGSEFIIALPII